MTSHAARLLFCLTLLLSMARPTWAQTVTPDSVRAVLRALYAAPTPPALPRLQAARRHAQRWVAANPNDGAGHAALALAWYHNGTGGYAFNDSALAHALRVGNDPARRADMVGIYRGASTRNELSRLEQAMWSDTVAAWAVGPTPDQPFLNTPAWYASQRASAWLGVALETIGNAEQRRDCALAGEARRRLDYAAGLYAALDASALAPSEARTLDITRNGSLPRQRARLEGITADACSPAVAQGDQRPQVGPGAAGAIRELATGLRPDIWDSLVVYMTRGVEIRTASAAWANPLLTVMDVTTGTATILFSDTAVQRATPAIWGGHVAWEDTRSRTRNPLGQAGYFQVYRFDPVTRRQLPVAPAPAKSQGVPRLSGSRLMWAGEDSVYARDLTGGPVVNLTATGACAGTMGEMGISGDRAVWSGTCDGNNAEVFLHDFSTATTTRLTREPFSQSQPDVSGDRVVWVEYQAPELAVMVRDLATGATTRLTPPGARPAWPRISGDWVVYVDRRGTGCQTADGPCPQVFRYDLATGRETQITARRTGSGSARAWGTRIVFWDRPRGGDAVMLYEEPGAIDPSLQPAAAQLEDAVRRGDIRRPDVADPARVLLRQASQHIRLGDRVAAGRSLGAAARYLQGRAGSSIASPVAQALVAALNAAGAAPSK